MPVAGIKKCASIEAKILGDKSEALNANMEEQIKLSMEKIEKSLNDNIFKDLIKIKSQIEESKNMHSKLKVNKFIGQILLRGM